MQIILFAQMMRFSFDEENNIYIPFNLLPLENQNLLTKQISDHVKEILDLEKIIKIGGFFRKSKTEKHKKQNLVDSILRIAYPYISEGRGWSSVWTKLPPMGKIEITVLPEFVPDGKEDKTRVSIGISHGKRVEVFIWRSEHGLEVSTTSEKFSFSDPGEEMRIHIPIQTLMMTSTGLSADYYGGSFGEYQQVGEHEGAVLYQQTHTVAGEVYKLYRNQKGWRVGSSFNGARLRSSKSERKSDVPPKTGWKYSGKEQWIADPALTLELGSLPHCGQITISATGGAAREWPDDLGVFTQTEMVSAGRRVFRQQGGSRVLCCRPGTHGWGVKDSVESYGSSILSASDSVCPADSRAAINKRKNLSSWQYVHDSEWKPGNITVICSTHSE